MGLRLRLRRAQADAGDTVLLYADEGEALTHPCLAHAWAERGADLRVNAPGKCKKVALMGALDAATGELVVSTSPTKAGADLIAFLRRLDWRYGPMPGTARPPVALVLDNGFHTHQQGEQGGAGRAPLDHRGVAAKQLNKERMNPHPCDKLEKAA